MAVSEQEPYIEYIANGSTNSFALEFDCENQGHLLVRIDEEAAAVGSWSFSNGAVVFNSAPANGKKIVIQRNTPLSRSTNFQSSNNSFRPETLNKDLDRIWLKLQELGITDHLTTLYVQKLHNEQWQYIDNQDTALNQLIGALSSHVDQADYELAIRIQKFREDVNLTALEQTLEQAELLKNSTAVLADEVESNIAQSQTLLSSTREHANAAASSATSANSAKNIAEQYANNIDASLTAIAGGHKAYATLAAALANTSTFPQNSIVEVTNDGANNGTYQWNGTTLTKSAYDPLTQARNFSNSNALFNPVLLSSENLNDLEKGYYLINNSPSNWAELNYPITGQCYIEVIKASGSLVKHQFIEYPAFERKFYRYFNGTTWSVKEIKSTSQLEALIKDLPTVATKRAQQTNLNDLTEGRFIQSVVDYATLDRNYPIANQICFITATKNTAVSSAVLQEIYYPTLHRLFYRYFNSSTWVTKELSTSIANETITPAMLTKTVSNAITPHLEFVKVGVSGNITFTPSTRTLAWTHTILAPYAGVGSRRIRIDSGSIVIPDSAYQYLYIDLNTVPSDGNVTADLLKIGTYGPTAFSVMPNQVPLVKTDGDKKPFSCAGFLPFMTLEQTNDLPIAAKDTFKFSKTLSGADIYLPCTDSTRLLRVRFYRQLVAFDGAASQSQSDLWRLGAASLVESETFGVVSSVVQDGEWDTAIRVDGAADHSGGIHGDELQTSSYFLIDGIYYDQDFLIDKEIKELVYVQKSNIYFEHTQNILCERLKVMTVTKSGIHNYQKLIFKAVATLQTAWITMLPIRRKLGALNDGANVTDTLIRFPGYELENVAETGFTQVFTPTDAGYSYLLFSKVSGIKAKVKFLSMKGLPSPNTHVSSAIQYNKLYFSAIYGRGQTYETEVDEVWELEAEYTFDKS